ncbi:MAG: site-specific integrase [Prevotellaceae bacterium]|jgi:integrase|nr:site-specific integrase [Prevotellaceae bacterium]
MEKVIFSTVYNRKCKIKKNGTAQIEICAYLNKERKYFATSIFVKPEQWDKKKQRIRTNTPNGIQLQKQVTDFILQLERYELDRRHSGKPFELDYLSACLQGKDFKYFTDFVKYELDTDKTNAQATKIGKTTTYNVLKDFKENILFDEINFELLKNFENYLIFKGLGINTRNKYFRHLRAFVNLAINKDYLELNKYPFRKFHAQTEATTREYLEPSEIVRLENLEFGKENAHLQKIKDVFLFACYTGLRFSDISAISKENLKQKDGGVWLETTMQKTNQPIKIPLYLLNNGKPIELLTKYKNPERNYFFDELTNQYTNRALKEIAKLAGINKRVTFHTARHTCATFLLYKGVAVTTVQKILGHKKLQTTQIYSKVMDLTMINELSKISY